MSHVALRALFVIVLVVLAGCSGTISTDPTATTSSTTTSTSTPTTTSPNETTIRSTQQVAPGVTESGVQDAFALANAHESALRDASYTVVRNETQRYANGTLRTRVNRTLRLGDGHARSVYVVDAEGSVRQHLGAANVHAEYWSNGTATYWARTTPENGTTYGAANTDRNPYAFSPSSLGETVYVYLDAVNASVEPIDGGERYRITGEELVRPDTLAAEERVESIENVSLGLVVGSDGVIHELHLKYDATVDGGTIHVTRNVRYVAVDETTVERPSWYDRVAGNASA